MATITKTVTENIAQEGKATWTVTHTGSNITVTGSSFTFTTPTVTAKYVYSGRSYGFAYVYLQNFYIGGIAVPRTTGNGWAWAKGTVWERLVAMSSGTAYTLSKVTSFDGNTYEAHTKTLQTSAFFNATNKTARSLNITASNWLPMLLSGTQASLPANGYNTGQTGSIGTLATVTLNAPPTFNSTDVTLTGSPYAGYVTATATISNLSAKYGGDISSAVLKIGNQTATRTTNGSFTPFTLTTAGTFTPTVTVTDSRGQVTTKNLAQITVLPYVAPNVSFNIERTTDVGVPNDEGESAVITTTFNYTDAVAHLTTPTITVKDLDNLLIPVITEWYSERETNGTFNSQNAISDWSEIEKGATIYCLIYNYKLTQDISVISEKKYYTRTGSDPYVYTEVNNPSGNPMQQGWYEVGVFDTQDSYQIELTPNDIDINNVFHSGTIITQTLGSAYYTVDFLAGGHGIAFGAAAEHEGIHIQLPTGIGQNLLFPTVSNSNTIDMDNYQLIVGKNNIQNNDAAFIIGNGNSINARSNVLTVDWDGNVEAAGDITGINVNTSNLIASNSIQVPKGKNIYLEDDNYINKFYCGTAGGTDNIYYKTDGYHAFFTADSTGRFYIQNAQVNSNVPYKAGGVKLFTIGWTAEVDNAQIAANGYADYKITIPSKSNYTPIAVVGYYFANATTNGANSSSISCNMAYYVSAENKARLMCRNHASSIARVRYAAAILYVATTQGI